MSKSLTLLVSYIIGFVGYAGFSLLFPVMPLYAKSAGASVSQVGLVIAVYSYVAAVTLIPFGMLSDKLGRRTLLIIGLALFAVAPLLYPLATSPEQLILFRAIHGLASATFIPAASALIVDLAPQAQRGEALGWFTASTQLSFVVGPITGGLVLNYYGFDAVFYACSAISLLGLLFLLCRLGDIPQKPTSEAAESSSWKWLRQRHIFGGLLAPFFVAVGSGTIVTYVPLYIRDFGISEVGAGLIITTLYASSALLRAPAGKLSDKVGRKPVILSGLALSAIAIAFTSLFHSLSPLMVTAIFFGIGMGVAMPASFALVADLSSPERRGLTMGMTSSFLQAGIAIGATVMGIVAEISSFEVMFLSCALSLTLGLFLILSLTRGHS